MTRATAALAIAAGLATSALAQTPSFTSDSTISMPLSWSEVNGNNNGLLEPGESAEVRLNVSFTNQFGIASFAPPIGTFTSGTILGLGSGFLDINGTGGTHGAFQHGRPVATNNGTTGYGVRSGWRIVGSPSHGSVNAAGTGITQIQFGNFSQWGPPTTNPIQRMYALLWTPTSYTNRTVTFQLAGFPSAGQTIASVYLDLDGQIAAAVYVVPANLSFGSVSIPIVPAPASLALLALAALGRRRHRSESDP